MEYQNTENSGESLQAVINCWVKYNILGFTQNSFSPLNSLLYSVHDHTQNSSLAQLLQRNSDLHWLQCNQSSVYWDPPATWHECVHMYIHVHVHVTNFFLVLWMIPRKQASTYSVKTRLAPDLCSLLYSLQIAKFISVFSCPLPLPSSVFETCDIYKLHSMPSTGQKASLSKR